MKTYYLDRGEIPEDMLTVLSVSLITSSEMEARTKIVIKSKFSSLLNHTGKELNKKVLKASKGSTVCFSIINPYEQPLKYSVALIPNLIKAKASDYFTYFKYAKK